MEFENIDHDKVLNDDSYFRGLVIAQLTHLHECNHRIGSTVKELEKKIETFNLLRSALVGGVSAVLATVAPELLKVIK